MRNFEKLEVWQQAMQLAKDTTKVTIGFPKPFTIELGSHLRKTATSVHSNIAEGSGRPGSADYARFLGYAMGSLTELRSQFIEAYDYDLVDTSYIDRATDLLWSVNALRKVVLSRVPNKR